MITLFGKRFLTDFIAGNSSFFNKDIAIGIAKNSEYALSETNSRLGFEFYRLPVRFGGIDIDKSVSPIKYTAIYTTTLPQDISGKINEIGLYPGARSSINFFDDKFITDFNSVFDWSPTPVTDLVNYRVGENSLVFTSNGSAEREYTSIVEGIDLSGYSNTDSLSLSYRVNDSNLSSIKVKFYSSETDYYQMIFDGHSVGDNIKEKTLSNLVAVGSPSKANINKIGIVISPTSSQSSVSMDGLRINDEDTFDPTYGLIARSNINEIEKVSGRELIIEFKLDLSFGS